jgi:RNA recognition motif-containing protein
MATKLFVGGLSWDTTDDSLKNFFASAGTVVSANVIQDKYTGRSRGFGFVEMSTDAEAEEAKKLNGQALDGRNISVNDARPQAPREGDAPAPTETQAPAPKAEEPVEEVAEEAVEETEEKSK